MTIQMIGYLGGAAVLSFLAVLDGFRVDRVLRGLSTDPAPRILNGIWRGCLIAILIAGLPLPPVVHLLPILLVAAAELVSRQPGQFVRVSGLLGLARDKARGEMPHVGIAGGNSARQTLVRGQPVTAELALASESNAYALQEQGQFDEAIAAWSEAVEKLAGVEAPWGRRARARALLGQAYASGSLGRRDQEMASLLLITADFSADLDPVVASIVDTALYNESLALVADGKLAESINSNDRLLRRLEARGSGTTDELVAETLVQKAITAQSLGDLDIELEAARGVLTKFDRSPTLGVQAQVAKALLAIGNALTLRGEVEGSLDAYLEVESRFGSLSDRGLLRDVADALVEAAALHAQTGRAAQATTECELVISRFGASDDDALAGYVKQARSLVRSMSEPS